MADFKLATENRVGSVEKTHATENEKNLLASGILYNNESANRARMFYESPTMFDFSKTSMTQSPYLAESP